MSDASGSVHVARGRVAAARRPWLSQGAMRFAFAALALGPAAGLMTVTALSIAVWSPASVAAMIVMAPCVLWISGGAATALLGLLPRDEAAGNQRPVGWRPASKTAVLVTLCGEDPGPVAQRGALLARCLPGAGLEDAVSLFVLSDTKGADAIAAEEAAFAPLQAQGILRYRRRLENTGRKPGNIAEWIETSGDTYSFMVVLDADSRMQADRIAQMIWRMERGPQIGLLQTGIAQVAARTRFAAMQRTAVRLLSPAFGAGLAGWAGESGNFWGHNAIIRVAAFRDAALRLPVLSGSAPMGGAILSHDFVEAALLRRAGWAVLLDPDLSGSAEEAPQTLAEFHRRDRRWCQGNLQHLRLLTLPGLDPISRLHMAAGIAGYLAAPAWFGLLVLTGSGALAVTSVWPIVLVAALLLLPKAVGLARFGRRATPRRAGVALRAAWGELAVSALVAPLVMVRQSAAVAAVALGYDCGWKRAEGRQRFRWPEGAAEAATGLALAGLTVAANPAALPWLAPIVLPLLSAPVLIRWLDRPA